MSKATSMLLAALGFGTASYLMFVPDVDQAASEKLASLVRIAADGSRAVQLARPEREATRDPASPQLIADKETSLTAGDNRRINLAQASNAERGQVAPPTPSTTDAGQRRSTVKPVDEESRRSLSRSIQAELKRVGCFDGEPDGVWNTPTRNALKTFIERINATLPVSEPDYILLTLLQGHTNRVCGKGCPTGQLLANDGRCQPKVIVAQAERKVPRREPKADNIDSGQRAASAQVAPEVFERERQAQVQAQAKAAEDARAKTGLDEARQRQEQLAKAEAERLAKADAERVARAKVAAVAEEARQRLIALADQQRLKEDAQRLEAALAAEQQRMKAETALAEIRRKQAALDDQQRAKAEAERRAAEEQRIKTAAAAEETRRKQLVADEQKRSKAEAERLADARAEDDARIKAAARAEDARRKQLIADEQNRSKAEAERLAAARAQEEAHAKAAAAAEDVRRKQMAAALPNAPRQSASSPPANDPARAAAATAPVMQPQILANVIPNSATIPIPPTSASTDSVPFTTGSATEPAETPVVVTPAPAKKAPPKPQQARKIEPNRERSPQRRQNDEPQPRYVQRFVPPSYVGRVQQAPAPAPRPVYYQAAQPNFRGSVFSDLSRNAP